jgi:hypothetical protein
VVGGGGVSAVAVGEDAHGEVAVGDDADRGARLVEQAAEALAALLPGARRILGAGLGAGLVAAARALSS